MENKEIRLHNFKTLLIKFKTNKEFSDAIDMDPSQVSQIKNGYNNIGDSLARQFENQFNKTKGWMDTLHDDYTPSDAPNNHLNIVRENQDEILTTGHITDPATITRIINIINKGVGADKFEKATTEEQQRLIKYIGGYLSNEKLSVLNDDTIGEMVRINNND
ncbi:MAG: hypothetical protein HOB14_13180 [Gammaproteobacteria bacterium]|jgi:hypothetical protein|nr:hypothetical protein [Gammaproteobacteria bacterium]MBT6702607.1 hypothetical protein [Gammaproteobacteria bacterium]